MSSQLILLCLKAMLFICCNWYFLSCFKIWNNHIFFTDVNDIKFVINYDYPNSSEDYVHRIGRTARSSNTGTAYTFFTANNAKQANELIQVLQEANQKVHPKLIQLAQSARAFGRGKSRFNSKSCLVSHL